jgi:hypothetical protein
MSNLNLYYAIVLNKRNILNCAKVKDIYCINIGFEQNLQLFFMMQFVTFKSSKNFAIDGRW